MNKEQMQEVCDWAEARDAKIEESLRSLMLLGVSGLSIAAPLLAVAGISGWQATLVKAALLSASLGILSSAKWLHWRVRLARQKVEDLVAQHREGRYGSPIVVNPTRVERLAEPFAYICFSCSLLLLVLGCVFA